MSRPTAADRVSRVLTIVPWIAANSPVTVTEVCERFGTDPVDLVTDLEIVSMVGHYPHTPDTLIELWFDGDQIELTYGNHFERPLRLRQQEALALLAAARGASGAVGADDDGPLARGAAKLATAMGVDPGSFEVVLDAGDPELREQLARAVAERSVVRIDYYSAARGEHTVRAVEPLRLFNTDGAWYLDAHCRSSDDARLFRVDRIGHLVETGERFERDRAGGTSEAFHGDPDLARVTLELEPAGRWVAEVFPSDSIEREGDLTTVTLPVTGRAWLERVLLQLGPHGRVLAAPDDWVDAGSRAANRILERYRH